MFRYLAQTTCSKSYQELGAVLFKNLTWMKAPLLGPRHGTGTYPKDDIVVRLSPDSETVVEPNIQIPVVGRASREG